MNFKKTKPALSPVGLEVCLNLWWFMDADTEMVFRLAGKTYALSGTDQEKLVILKKLAVTDFHVAQNFKVEERFGLVSEFGEQTGVVPPSAIRDDHEQVFLNVINQLEKNLPHQLRTINSEYQQYTMVIPQDPLCVTTCVVEKQDGSLTPLIS